MTYIEQSVVEIKAKSRSRIKIIKVNKTQKKFKTASRLEDLREIVKNKTNEVKFLKTKNLPGNWTLKWTAPTTVQHRRPCSKYLAILIHEFEQPQGELLREWIQFAVILPGLPRPTNPSSAASLTSNRLEPSPRWLRQGVASCLTRVALSIHRSKE